MDINAEGLATLASDRIHVERADITKSAECKKVAERASSFGKGRRSVQLRWVMIHHARRNNARGRLEPRHSSRIVPAIFLMAKHVIPHMEAAGGGAIVNMSSVQAHATQPDVAAYTATKGAGRHIDSLG